MSEKVAAIFLILVVVIIGIILLAFAKGLITDSTNKTKEKFDQELNTINLIVPMDANGYKF